MNLEEYILYSRNRALTRTAAILPMAKVNCDEWTPKVRGCSTAFWFAIVGNIRFNLDDIS